MTAPNSPHKSSAIQIAARCWQQRQLPSRRRHRSSATSPIHVGYAPQPTHTPPTDPREPSSLHQPAPRTLLRAVLPALPTQLRLLRGQNIFDFETCPIKSLNPSASHKKGGCSPSLLPCTLSLRSATTFCLRASPPLHLISSLSTISSFSMADLYSQSASYAQPPSRSTTYPTINTSQGSSVYPSSSSLVPSHSSSQHSSQHTASAHSSTPGGNVTDEHEDPETPPKSGSAETSPTENKPATKTQSTFLTKLYS